MKSVHIPLLLFNPFPSSFLSITLQCSHLLYQNVCLQVIVSGKLRAARAKSMKFKDGYMVSSGQPTKDYIDSAVRHVLLRQVSFSHESLKFSFLEANTLYLCRGSCVTRAWFDSMLQGVLGIKVKIMLDWDPTGKVGPKTPLPDVVIIHAPKEEEFNQTSVAVAAPVALVPEAPLTTTDYPEMPVA